MAVVAINQTPMNMKRWLGPVLLSLWWAVRLAELLFQLKRPQLPQKYMGTGVASEFNPSFMMHDHMKWPCMA